MAEDLTEINSDATKDLAADSSPATPGGQTGTPAPGDNAGGGQVQEPDVLDDFTLEGNEADAAGEAVDAGGEYKLDFGEENIPEQLATALGRVAREAGADPVKAVKLMMGAQAAQDEYRKGVQRELGQKLKADWGSQFEANMKATKAFMVRVAHQAGIPMEQMQGMATPQGFRLMNACRALVSEGGQKLAGTQQQPVSAEQQLNDIYSDPEQYKAMMNPSDPRFREVTNKVNALMGLPPLP